MVLLLAGIITSVVFNYELSEDFLASRDCGNKNMFCFTWGIVVGCAVVWYGVAAHVTCRRDERRRGQRGAMLRELVERQEERVMGVIV